MRALTITAPGATAFAEIPVPVPKADEILVQVKRVGYCGSDLATFRGANPLVTLPRIPGHEVSGVVAAHGAGVAATDLPLGTEVLCLPYTSCGQCSACQQGRFNCCRFNQTLGVQRDGAMTEFISLPQEKVVAAAGLSLRDLASVEPLTVGMHAAVRGRVGPGDLVGVFGCGAIGLGAIAGAAARGGVVVAIDIDDGKLALAKRSGASHTINSTTQDLHAELQRLSNGHGPRVMIEAVGNPATFRAAVDEVCWAGRVVYIGYTKAPVEYDTKYFVQKEIDILGSRNATPDDFRAVIDLLRAGKFPMEAFITREVPFAEADQALHAWAAAPAQVTKIQVLVS
jgi:threonine dehydrogenase-like Zn-dependent dehydrogenase